MVCNAQHSLRGLGMEKSLINILIGFNKNFGEKNGAILPKLLYLSTNRTKRSEWRK